MIARMDDSSGEIIRGMRREGKSWREVCNWITRQIGYDTNVVEWARKVYNDEAAKLQTSVD